MGKILWSVDPIALYLPYMVWILVPAVSFFLGLTKARLGWMALLMLIFFAAGVMAWLGATQSIYMEILSIVTLGGSFLIVYIENFFLIGFVATLVFLIGWLIATALRPG